jgi:hypothetical protein
VLDIFKNGVFAFWVAVTTRVSDIEGDPAAALK